MRYVNTLEATLHTLSFAYDDIRVVNIDQWTDYEPGQTWLIEQCRGVYQTAYSDKQRLMFVMTYDYYVKNTDQAGLILRNLRNILHETDIDSFYVIVASTNPNLEAELARIDWTVENYQLTGEFTRHELDRQPASRRDTYQYGSADPIKIDVNSLTSKERFLLTGSQTFCMYPWIHLHAWPTGQAFPCCHSEWSGQLGNCHEQSLADIWNGEPMKQLRVNMLTEKPTDACRRCYEQEQAGFFSGRQSANKHHGHHIDRAMRTSDDGYFNEFEMTYWDIRFSNLCNLRCRSCGHIFSSQWYSDQAQLAGGDWKKHNKPLLYAGRTETDIWQQLEPHLDYVEQIYFAGGEPLLMEEHYNILEELVRRKRFDVRLIYNTNFTHTQLKDRSVFEYWKLFDSVAVGASLDADGPRAEYIRKGTDWAKVESNRIEMMSVCPNVDFYISPTLSIMNAWHLPDFHRMWTELGFINPQDLNVNILQDPVYYRIDIATPEYKDRLREKYLKHLEWLRPLDPLRRASVGFESAIKFMDATDNSHLLPEFWSRTQTLDALRNEDILQVIPELVRLK